jgi:1-acyl-sn-glycerol-3-phosphate acyltransferase
MTWTPLRVAWGLWVYLLVVPVLLVAALPILALPRLETRRAAAGAVGRAYFRLCGFQVRTTGLDRLPPGACVIVANHASYLDGPLLFALLPPRFGFVIKKEAARLPLVGLLLHRLGHHFVERANRHQGGSDARRILRSLEDGEAVAFFPEGTFHPQAGIARFHGGAFALAARTGLPVAPVAIRGTRHALGGGSACHAGDALKSRCSNHCRRRPAPAMSQHASAMRHARGSGRRSTSRCSEALHVAAVLATTA